MDDESYDIYSDLCADVGVTLDANEAHETDGSGGAFAPSSAHGAAAKEKSCSSCNNLTEQLVSAQCEIAQLKSELAIKDSKLTAAIRQNGTLLRNLSLLFVTAQAEIDKLRSGAAAATPASSLASASMLASSATPAGAAGSGRHGGGAPSSGAARPLPHSAQAGGSSRTAAAIAQPVQSAPAAPIRTAVPSASTSASASASPPSLPSAPVVGLPPGGAAGSSKRVPPAHPTESASQPVLKKARLDALSGSSSTSTHSAP